jgi:hypothetical protein
MTEATREIDKVDRSVKEQLEELYSAFPESDRSSPSYLVQWNRIHAYNEVWKNVAFDLPLAGRVAEAAVDAKTTVRILELILERQARAEAKVDQIVSVQRTISSVMSALCLFLLAALVSQYFSS